MDIEGIKWGLAGAIVTRAMGPDLGKDHPSIRLLAESVMGVTSQATNRALDRHVDACRCCESRIIAMANLAALGVELSSAASHALKVRIWPAQALLVDCH